MRKYRIVPRVNGDFSCEYRYDWAEDDAWSWLRDLPDLREAKQYIAKCQEKDRKDQARLAYKEQFEKENPPIYFY